MGDRADKVEDARAKAKREEAEALTRDVREAAERVFGVWAKAHQHHRARLNAGEHMIAVLQGNAIALGAQGAALCFANKGSDSTWLRGLIVGEVARAFDKTLADLKQPPATATKQ